MLLATYNIQYGLGRDDVYDVERIADTVAAADIICLQEVVRGWLSNGQADQAAEIGDRLNRYWVYGPGLDVDVSTTDAQDRITNRRRQFGNMVLSRWPILSTRTLPLPRRPYHEIFDIGRSVIEAVIETPVGRLRVYSVHVSHLDTNRRQYQIRALLRWLDRGRFDAAPWDHTGNMIKREGLGPMPAPEPVILAGDFNCQADAKEYEMLSGRTSPRGRRFTPLDRYVDTWTAVGNAAMAGTTCVGDVPRGDFRIDYVFVSPSLAPRVQAVRIDETAQGSDHNPVFVTFAD